jgi:putative phosphoesterase
MKSETIVGVISDTHGLLREEVVRRLGGVDHIIHAGDVGTPDILDALRSIAPLTAVRGNVDHGAWADDLPETEALEIAEVLIYVIHDALDLDIDPTTAGFAAVVSGHSHQPSFAENAGVLFLNPGSAGPRRFDLPISLVRLHIEGQVLTPRLIEIKS